MGTRNTLPTSPQQFSSLPQLTRTTVPSSTSCTPPMSQSVTRKMVSVCQAHFPLRDFVLTRRPESPQARGLLHSSLASRLFTAYPGLTPGLAYPGTGHMDSCIEFPIRNFLPSSRALATMLVQSVGCSAGIKGVPKDGLYCAARLY